MAYDIFISYKRLGVSKNTASALYNLLVQKGYNVFLDRKELRAGDFNTQLLGHISDAKDIIILLEEHSLDSWFSHRMPVTAGDDLQLLQADLYKTDWFCREIMHALELEGKNIIPVLLDGYRMPDAKELPPEMQQLSFKQGLQLDDIIDLERLYDDSLHARFLQSKPQNMAISRQYRNADSIVSRFLFYSDAASCDLFEQGEHIQTLTDAHDEQHPFVFPVQFAGEHRFRFFNNDTCEEQFVSASVAVHSQTYVPVLWPNSQNPWQLTPKLITSMRNAETLFRWGKGLYEGTSKNAPDLTRATLCMKQAIARSSREAADYVLSHESADIASDGGWTELAASSGSVPAMLRLALWYYNEGDELWSVRWCEKAAKAGNAEAAYNAGVICLGGPERFAARLEKTGGGTDTTKRAFRFFQQAADMGYTAAYSNLARYLYRVGSLQESFDWAHKAYKVDPSDLQAAKTILQIYVLAADTEKQQKWLAICRKILSEQGVGEEEQKAFMAEMLTPDEEVRHRAEVVRVMRLRWHYPNSSDI